MKNSTLSALSLPLFLVACSGSAETSASAATTGGADPTTSAAGPATATEVSTGGTEPTTTIGTDPTTTGGSGPETAAATTSATGSETAATTTSATDGATTSATDGATTSATGVDATTTSGTDSDTASGTGEPIAIDCAIDAWDLDADLEWKTAWMAACMVPTIAPILQGIDPVLYQDFTCTHCHGADLGGGTYAMPATTPLDFTMPDAWDKAYFDKMKLPDTPMFKVMNTAAGVLGYEPYNQNNPDSFGCEGCHLKL
jgi:hypothetical protein